MVALASDLSRRAAEEAIARGEVTVNGEVVTKLGTSVDPVADKVKLRGMLLAPSVKKEYIAFHKPRGEIVTKSDPQGRPTIWPRFGRLSRSLNSVGRLDFDSEGLLILTDDGDLINRLTHPKHEIWKTYLVWISGKPDSSDIELLRNGVKLSDGTTLPARVKPMRMEEMNSLIEISIREGRNRQVRRMFEAIKCKVRTLKRTAIGPVKLGRLTSGNFRKMTSREVMALLGERDHKRHSR
jgi:pseudouridine synthase